MSDQVAKKVRNRENTGQIHELVLAGCTPTPLASYLKALGALRLVAEQADPAARGCWRNGLFALCSELDKENLFELFLNQYKPTPVIAPWNGGSGFYPKDNQSGIRPISEGKADRFAPMRVAIERSRATLEHLGIREKPVEEKKAALLRALRSELDERALAWLDAAVVLSEGSPKYPPLLGTGGNDGRLDFTNNFMQRLVALIDPDDGSPRSIASNLLESAFFNVPIPGLTAAAIGQFSPGSAGGPNLSTGFSAEAGINPWDFVLMLEGALLFATAATRRLESQASGALSYPFTVRPTGSGTGGAALGDEGNARAEIWLPLWERPASLPELRALFTEGRATVGRRAARDGLDFVRAVSRLGVERGITSFQRYAFLMRSGKAYLATPLDRIAVRNSPSTELIDELDRDYWLNRFRQLGRAQNATNRIQSLVRRLEDALFDLSRQRDNLAPKVQRVLVLLGEAELYLARSPKARESCPPAPWLMDQWLFKAEDGSGELAIAAALAGLHGRHSTEDARGVPLMRIRTHLAPENAGYPPEWLKDETHDVTWNYGTLDDNLLNILRRRLLYADRMELPDKPFHSKRVAPLAAVAAWLADELDVSNIATLLPGLALVQIPSGSHDHVQRDHPLPASYRMLKPFFCTNEQLRRADVISADKALPIPTELIRRLAGNDVDGALALASGRLRVAGIPASYQTPASAGVSGRRLLAALLVPISSYELGQLLPSGWESDMESERSRKRSLICHSI